MVNYETEYLFAQWLENNLNAEEQCAFEQLCLNDSTFAHQVEMATQLQVTAEQFAAPPLPKWDKDSTYLSSQTSKWWQWQGLPMVSMAMSAMAMVMVVSGFSVSYDEGQVTLGFQRGPSQAQVDALINAKILDYQQSNQAIFTQYANAINEQQQENSTQLAQYLLSSSRQERREDFAELVQYINEQRDDDQRYYTRQLTQLQREINSLDDSYMSVSE